jgi:hypothetical protein
MVAKVVHSPAGQSQEKALGVRSRPLRRSSAASLRAGDRDTSRLGHLRPSLQDSIRRFIAYELDADRPTSIETKPT